MKKSRFAFAFPDPGSDAFFTLDPGSQTHIFDSLMTNFWVKSTIILSVLAKKKHSQFYDICGYKKGRTKNSSPPSFLDPVSEIWDPGWTKIRIRDPG
jgi:hypothetical protein